MHIETVPISQLKAAPYNPRVDLKPGDPAYERLRRSIEEFDLVEPLVWNRRTGHLVGGHQRLKIIRSRGDTEAQVSVVDLPPERERALNVALNNANLAGDWDLEKLADLVSELVELPEFDATLTGFDADELRSLCLAPAPDADADEPPDDAEADDAIEVRLLVAPDRWEAVRPALDVLIAEHGLRCHVLGRNRESS